MRHWKKVVAIGVVAVASAVARGGRSASAVEGAAAVPVSAPAAAPSAGGATMAMTNDEHRRDVEEWYRGRIARLTKEDGWLTLVGLFPLPEGRHRFGSAEDNECVFPESSPRTRAPSWWRRVPCDSKRNRARYSP